jgi:hypothetical protein
MSRQLAISLAFAGVIALGLGYLAITSMPRIPKARAVDYGEVKDALWTALPDEAQIAKAYPAKARTAQLYGAQPEALIHCKVTEAGDLSGCMVMSEAPAGYGFGEAAILLAAHIRLYELAKDGTPVAGRPITVPVKFPLKPPA